MLLSIIVPVLNEQDSLVELHRQIEATCSEHKIAYELIFIDDGSTDQSWSIIQELATVSEPISGIQFRRNFGKAAALTAGMRAAEGDCLMMMDADLQDDPAEIPKFLEKFNEGFDVVNGWKERRLDPWHKVYPSRVFNWMIGTMTGLRLHDHNCGLKLFDRDVAAEIRIYGELHRFIPVLAHSKGFKVAELPVHHRPRQFGHSKYGIIRFLRGFLDLGTVTFLIGYGQRPQHLLGAMGLTFFGIGLAGFAYLTMLWGMMNIFGVLTVEPIGSRPLLAYSVVSIILGAQAMSLGLLAELLIANTGREGEQYSVSQRTDLPAEKQPVNS